MQKSMIANGPAALGQMAVGSLFAPCQLLVGRRLFDCHSAKFPERQADARTPATPTLTHVSISSLSLSMYTYMYICYTLYLQTRTSMEW